MPLVEEAQKAARLLREHAYVRLVARESGDAICATTLLGHALRREGIDFHISWTPRLTRGLAQLLSEEANDVLVLVGLAADAEESPAATRRILLDDNASSHVPGDASLGGEDASLGALAHVLAVALAPRNEDLACLALAGALASRRHIGGLQGLDAALLEDAVRSGTLTRDVALALRGPNLLVALSSLDDPAVQGITGRARNVKKLVADLGLMPESPVSGLQPPDAERLGSFLAARLLQQAAPDAALDALFRPRIRAQRGPHTGMDAADLAWLAESAAAASRGGLAFAALWPDEASSSELGDVATSLREEVVAALLKAERELRREGNLAVMDAPRASLAAPLADRAALALAPGRGIAIARAPDGDATFLALRGFGRELGTPTRAAAATCGAAVWASGSAARVTVLTGDEGRFLKALAEALG